MCGEFGNLLDFSQICPIFLFQHPLSSAPTAIQESFSSFESEGGIRNPACQDADNGDAVSVTRNQQFQKTIFQIFIANILRQS